VSRRRPFFFESGKPLLAKKAHYGNSGERKARTVLLTCDYVTINLPFQKIKNCFSFFKQK